MDIIKKKNDINNMPDSILSYILSLVYEYKYKDNTNICYLLVNKRFNNLIQSLKCNACKKGLYIIRIPRPCICSLCGHNLERKDIVRRRAELYNFNKKY